MGPPCCLLRVFFILFHPPSWYHHSFKLWRSPSANENACISFHHYEDYHYRLIHFSFLLYCRPLPSRHPVPLLRSQSLSPRLQGFSLTYEMPRLRFLFPLIQTCHSPQIITLVATTIVRTPQHPMHYPPHPLSSPLNNSPPISTPYPDIQLTAMHPRNPRSVSQSEGLSVLIEEERNSEPSHRPDCPFGPGYWTRLEFQTRFRGRNEDDHLQTGKLIETTHLWWKE